MSHSKTKKFFSGFVALALALSIALSATTAQAAALTQSQIDAIVSLLQSFGADAGTINNVKTSLTGGTPSPSPAPVMTGGYVFTTDLTIGSKGEAVWYLQKALNSNPATQVAATGPGSPGSETQYFGPATQAAVKKFQAMKSINATGYVGPLTRAALNSMGGVTTTPSPTPTAPVGSGVSISNATQPANAIAPQSAARIPFTRFSVTAGSDGDVTINSVEVERTGAAVDSVFGGVALLDENGIQIGIAKTLNSNHRVSVGEPFVVKAGQTRTFTIAGNMGSSLSNQAGQVAALSVVGLNTSAAVSGTLPITGAFHTINATLTIGSLTVAVSSFDPNSSQTKEIGTTGYKFSGIRVTAGSAEDLKVKSIRWYQAGSVSSGDLANIKTVVDGTKYDTMVSADGKYYTTIFPNDGITIAKGISKDIYIEGDLIGSGAANRTVRFDIYKTTDLYVWGTQFGYGITPPAGSGTASNSSSEFTASTPWFDGSQVTISAGSATTIAKSNAAPSQNIAINVPNQPLGSFETDFKGEPVSVQQIIFSLGVTGSGGQVNDVTNVSIYDENGAVVAGPVDASGAAAWAASALTFTDTITFPVGKKTYILKGKIGTDFTNGQTVTASSTPSSQWTNITGQVTGNTISLTGNGVFTMNTMTVKSGSLAISVSPNPAAQNVIAGGQEVLFSNYLFDATQSGEDVRFSSIPLQYTFTGTNTDLTNCRLYDGATALNSGSNVVNPDVSTGQSETFTFDSSLVIAKGSIKTIALKCSLKSGATGTYSWGIAAAPSITVSGVTSSTDISESVSSATGQTMSAVSGGKFVAKNDNSLLYRVVQANTTDVVLARLNFTASSTEDVVLKKIAVYLGGAASNTPADLVGEKVTFWLGSTQVGQALLGNSDYATSTELTPEVKIPKGETITITVKGDLLAINDSTGRPGSFIQVNYDGTDSGVNGSYGRGVDSQGVVSGTSGSVTTNGVRVFRSVPTIEVTSTGCTGCLSAGSDLYKVKITAPAARAIGLRTLSFNVNSVGLSSVSGFQLYGPNGAVNSTGVATTTATSGSTSTGERLTINFDDTSNDRVVEAGTSKTYTLRATTINTLTSTNVETLNIKLLSDTAYPSSAYLMSTVAGIQGGYSNSASTTDRLIWTGFSSTTPEATAQINSIVDWSNGYGLPGFPSAGQDFPYQGFNH